ncbi:imidazole glycerol phosphate synthase subunit HisF [Rhabdochromatium marinum]|uniref:imidazole glycerol phosphate synthase subunit HisF n=1 Tax=Rhabdochromatium marinum TaxID=48729 RepID=UPI0019088CE8|nr:imidazole glycerol phosphate synthase subunit HisF [Rhabdochromatium marinum]MBK1648478.1 imidazole glycerol phosphate synthase HisHF [Rhabdochromatium marinum]
MIALLDYGAGNVRSVRNAIAALGYPLSEIRAPEDILAAERLIFPGVGAFGPAMQRLREQGFEAPLREFLLAGRPFLGICIGLQSLFEGSEESPGVPGLGIIPGQVRRFDNSHRSVPHMGWNGLRLQQAECELLEDADAHRFYFVHSYFAEPEARNRDWVLAETDYGRPFISAVQQGEVAAVQFHPEKSGAAGLEVLRRFLAGQCTLNPRPLSQPRSHSAQPLSDSPVLPDPLAEPTSTALARRIIACLDVRTNDQGDLVVTKGDQYDVREQGEVRNLGKPVELAKRYYAEGADEITFLNITAFRDFPLADQPMLKVLRRASEEIFVPLTIGGGIRAFVDQDGRHYSALDVAAEYFRSGADKVSIGSEAVLIAEAFHACGGQGDGSSAIEQIAQVYGNQAVVISVDPRRVYVDSPAATPHHCIETQEPGPQGERYCWFQCTIKGGREGRDLDVLQLVQACEQLGAGEILVNSIDRDGSGRGFDLELLRMVREGVRIPVIASSGAGCPEHFSALFDAVDAEAALAAGIFHRREVPIDAVKAELDGKGEIVRA